MLLEMIAEIRPATVLDVGCGYGEFTSKMAACCGSITAIDVSRDAIARAKAEHDLSNIEYIQMDGRQIRYPDRCFDMAIERVSLHHVLEWDKVLDEMIRVSSKHILVEEPFDDQRSEPKRNAVLGQRLYLEVQRDAGYTHFEHIKPDALTGYFRTRNVAIDTRIEKSDQLVDFNEFFSAFDYFADRTQRQEYWRGRLDDFRSELDGKPLCRADLIMIHAALSG